MANPNYFTRREFAMMRDAKGLRARHKREREADAVLIAALQQSVDELSGRLDNN